MLVGSAAFLAERGVEWHRGRRCRRSTAVVAWEGRVRGWLALADEVRPEGRGLAAALAALGLRVTLLSGDREAAARPLAAEVGIATVHAGCTPADKAALIQAARREGGAVGMVGDGINDAPALAAADVGIALAGGTNLAREAGDVVLLGDELHRIPWSIELARAAYRIIRQNLLWAFGYNTIALAVAFSGRLHPLLAAVLMLLSSLFVLGNSLRLLREGDSCYRRARPASRVSVGRANASGCGGSGRFQRRSGGTVLCITGSCPAPTTIWRYSSPSLAACTAGGLRGVGLGT